MNGDQNTTENNWQHKPWRRKKFWGIVILLIILAVIFCHHDNNYHYGANGATPPSIVVSGHGEVFASPDIATFSFSALGRGSNVSDAQNKMTTVANAAIDYLKKNGVDAKDIQTTDYSVNPTYQYNNIVCPQYGPCPPSGTPTITGYEVTETVTVKLRDTTKSGEMLGGVGALGVSNVNSLDFTIDNPDALKEQARKMAIDKAETEAKQLAKDLHVHLKRVLSFSESGNPTPIYERAMGLSADAKAPTVPTIEPGQNKITSDVTITYEIR